MIIGIFTFYVPWIRAQACRGTPSVGSCHLSYQGELDDRQESVGQVWSKNYQYQSSGFWHEGGLFMTVYSIFRITEQRQIQMTGLE